MGLCFVRVIEYKFVSSTTQTLDRPLTAADRCDRCGAQAYVRVTLTSGELLFCAHHAHDVLPAVRETAIEIHDETGRLIDK